MKEVSRDKENVILINKADLLTEEQRGAWARFFEQENVKVIFWSALAEGDRLSPRSKVAPPLPPLLGKNTSGWHLHLVPAMPSVAVIPCGEEGGSVGSCEATCQWPLTAVSTITRLASLHQELSQLMPSSLNVVIC